VNFAEAAYFTDFGVPATLDGAPVRGIFDNAYGESFGLVASSSPVFRLPSSIAVTTGQTLVIAATTYTVAGIEPDGTGLTVLRLEKA
jgi:hypothetical protein